MRKECKVYEEYMTSLTEQVHDARAKRMVAKELGNHIEEQADCYEACGMNQEEALIEAVRQMGDPVETGIELNKIHKPKTPFVLLGLSVGMMLIAITMQAIIFAAGGNELGGMTMLSKTIVYNIAGFCIILGLLHCDYNFIAKYAYQMYGVYIVGMPVLRVLVYILSNMGYVTPQAVYYGVQMAFPVIFAGIIYRNRKRGLYGAGVSLFLGILGVIWSSTILGGSDYRYSAVAETLLIIILMLVIAFIKNIFGITEKNRRKTFLIGSVIFSCCIAVGIFCLLGGTPEYYLGMRILNAFTGNEVGYMNLLLRESIADASWIGGQQFFLGEPNRESYGLFVLNAVFTYFGKLAGVLVGAVYLGFLLLAFRMSFKQSNRMGMLVGTACTVSIFVRFVAYLACNLGFGLWWTTLVPFLSYGRVSAVMNGIYIGLILCVYRNSRILAEEKIEQKPIKRIRIVVE